MTRTLKPGLLPPRGVRAPALMALAALAPLLLLLAPASWWRRARRSSAARS